MAVYNPITGLKRKLPRYFLPRKKRQTASSTVAARMYGKQAMDAFFLYMKGVYMCLMVLVIAASGRTVSGTDNDLLFRVYAAMTCHYFSLAVAMLKLDSMLLDIHNPDDDVPFANKLVGVSLDSFADDNECESKTRFSKRHLEMILESLGIPDEIKLRYNPKDHTAYYKFSTEELLIYTLRKMATGRHHKDLADAEFGGCSGRWGRGYSYFVKLLDRKWYQAIGPAGLRLWVNQFPYFAETLREYVNRRKERVDNEGNITYRELSEYPIPPGEFNIFSFTDCTVYECCRPGSGPANSNQVGAPRRRGWYIRQRAFFDGYHRGMEACVKILTLLLPNGITCAIYGPTSGRQGDRKLFTLSEMDDYLMELCQQVFGDGRLYCTYGDGIFAGRWYCLRTRHEAAPGTELTDEQEEQNDNMKSARESVEHSYAKAETLWPLMLRKEDKKIELDPDRFFGEIRVMYMLNNLKVCSLEGSTMTGTRMFACPPPTFEDYLNMISGNN